MPEVPHAFRVPPSREQVEAGRGAVRIQGDGHHPVPRGTSPRRLADREQHRPEAEGAAPPRPEGVTDGDVAGGRREARGCIRPSPASARRSADRVLPRRPPNEHPAREGPIQAGIQGPHARVHPRTRHAGGGRAAARPWPRNPAAPAPVVKPAAAPPATEAPQPKPPPKPEPKTEEESAEPSEEPAEEAPDEEGDG